MKKYILFLTLVCAWIPVFAQHTKEEGIIDSLMSRMSLEEKIGQLNQVDGRMDQGALEAQIRAGNISSIMNITDSAQINHLQRVAVEESRSGIPIVFSRDVVHGFKTMLPIPLGQAASWNEDLVREGARMAAIEATESGIRWGFAPMIDICRDSRWGRIAESFGEDPLLTARMGLSVVSGYQTDDLSSPTAIAACAKHFVGYGAARGGRDYNGSSLSLRELLDSYLPPFRIVMNEGCASIMTSFQDNDGVPTSADSFLLKGIIRDEWGWTGLIVSDYGSIGQLMQQGIAASKKDAARIGLDCGTDMDMMSGVYLRYIKELLSEGEITIHEIDQAVRNVLRFKLALGLFSNSYSQKVTNETASDKHLHIALKSAEESAVLLKNDGILPLDPSKKMTVLVTGPMSDAAYDQLGTWDMDGDTTLTITPLKAFRKRAGKNLKVVYLPGLDYSRDKNKSEWGKVAMLSRDVDVVILCLGEEQILSGEAHSLADIGLKGAQTEYLRYLSTLGKPIVVSVMSGRANTIEEECGLSNAVVLQFHPGTMGGEALAEIVFGQVNPSGKLPVTFPRMVGQIPIYYNELRNGRSSYNPKAVRSLDDIPRSAKQSVLGHDCRYLDAGTKPLFPFGYGLSYSVFDFSEPTVKNDELSLTDTLEFSIKLINKSDIAGKDVVQVYVKDEAASVVRPGIELKSYKKIALGPKEEKLVDFRIPVSSLGFYDVSDKYIVEPGAFKIYIADCSDTEYCDYAKTFEIKVR